MKKLIAIAFGLLTAISGHAAEETTQPFKYKDVQLTGNSKLHVTELACASGGGEDCYTLGRMYFRADGVLQDKSRALEYYTQACDLKENRACFNLGWMYISGDGVPRNPPVAVEYYVKACKLGDSRACFNLQSLGLPASVSKIN